MKKKIQELYIKQHFAIKTKMEHIFDFLFNSEYLFNEAKISAAF